MQVGKRIRELRKKRDMTLEELSQKSGVALATLSRMENGKMTGTLASHNRICKALGTSLGELYKEVEDSSKTVESVPKTGRAEPLVHTHKVRYELLVTKTLNKKIMPLIIKVSSGGETRKEENEPGVEKFVYIISGSLEAVIGDRSYTLKRGDSLYFDASLPHVFKNRTKIKAAAICIISPPTLR